MSQISKCPTLRVVLGYWEALGEVSEMRYNNLLYCSSKRSYCTILVKKDNVKFDNSIGLHYCCIMYPKTLLLGKAYNLTQIVSGQFFISIFVPHSWAWWRNTYSLRLKNTPKKQKKEN